ncbi:hypothetical protein B4U79_05241 [Dinothrombium tinctorium]|uniref:Spaetzle domain-containing protein n=1 Tax=Dinothrombium tinctorium TaxID=1965070 RepID=A0A443RNR6_9ACAR|nr:hypothetical protein B4U79_05241 [Dinothrombium tinctorium]
MSLHAFLQIVIALHYANRVLTQMTCGPKVSPRLLLNIPCDMSKTAYCVLPGSAYPWNSVRRYIRENQGLVKRMYGDQRQSLIMMNEINDIKDRYDKVFVYGKREAFPEHPHFSPRAAFLDLDPLPADEMPVSPSPTTASNPVTNTTTATSSITTDATTKDTLLPNAEEQLTTLVSQAEAASSSQKESSSSEAEVEITTVAPKSMAQTSEHFYSSKIEAELPIATTQPTSSSQSVPSPEPNFSKENVEKKGVNACPVKEEVIAPYWANNTRGEVLALLNVYPFEQYIHWEKCSFENSQMFCRQGCRCEQQFRLHRLLAFDPKNECRGIFADWFRFPSCCVCICYDLPESSVFYRIHRRKSRL